MKPYKCSKFLRFTKLTLLSERDCTSYFPNVPILKTDICASYQDNKATTAGDSGGGLIVKGEKGLGQHSVLVGVYVGGSMFGRPVLFTRVSGYISWIERTTQKVFDNNVVMQYN